MFTVRKMRYFEALATTLHFRKAAELAHVSQPALSAQIAEMEEIAGAQLFERTRKSVMLTEMGHRLLPRIRSILAEIQALEEIAAQRNGVLQGRIRLGIIPTIAPYMVPVLIPLLRERYPALKMVLKEAVTSRLLEDLRAGDLDTVVAALPVEDDRLMVEPVFQDRFLIATSENDHDILSSPLTQENVAVERLLLLEEGHCLREQALAVCSATKTRQLVNYGATSMATLLQMVSHGMGLTLIPEIAVRAEASRMKIRIVPFAGSEPKREIGLIWRRQSERQEDFRALAGCVGESAGVLKLGEKEMAGSAF